MGSWGEEDDRQEEGRKEGAHRSQMGVISTMYMITSYRLPSLLSWRFVSTANNINSRMIASWRVNTYLYVASFNHTLFIFYSYGPWICIISRTVIHTSTLLKDTQWCITASEVFTAWPVCRYGRHTWLGHMLLNTVTNTQWDNTYKHKNTKSLEVYWIHLKAMNVLLNLY